MPQRSIPTLHSKEQLADYLKNYQQAISQNLRSVPTPIAPFNFKVKSQRGGILVTWSPIVYAPGQTTQPALVNSRLSRADGYELQRSATGDFSPGKFTSIALRDPTQSSYFDALGGAPQTFYYRLRATNGTTNNPYNIHGLFTMALKITSIDATDVGTAPVTITDTFTTSNTNKRAGNHPNGINSPWQGA